MTYNFNYYPSPGIFYDVIRMLYVNLNSQSTWKEKLTPVGSFDDTSEYILTHANSLTTPKPELSLFFFIPSNRTDTFISSITESILQESFCAFSLDSFLSYLDDTNKVKNDVLSYYLGADNQKNTLFESLIRNNKYITDKIKLLLFGFFYDPTIYISILRGTLILYYKQINEKWTVDIPSYDDLSQLMNSINCHNTSCKATNNSPSSKSTIHYSLCRCTEDFLIYHNCSQTTFFISTPQTISKVKANTLSFHAIDLQTSIHALDDSYRLKIIKLLSQSDSLSPNTIADEIKLSLTATKYHLSQLRVANLVNVIKKGRTIYYSINLVGYENLIHSLQNYLKEDSRHENME